MSLSRRKFMQATGSGLLLAPAARLMSQAPPALPLAPMVNEFPGTSQVVMVQGDDRKKNITAVLEAMDDQIRPKLKQKKTVVIKPNDVSTVNQLAATHADTLRAILEYLAPRFKGPIVIAESSAGNTPEAFENFHYNVLPKEYAKQKVSLVDLNTEGKYVMIPLIDFDLHVTPARIAARLVDPDAFVISSAMMKSHNTVVATLSVKNMVMGSPLHYAPGESARWSDKHKYHLSPRHNHYNMLLTAQKLRPNWGLAIIDGYEGLEGDGPMSGNPVASRIAIASTDFIAADRVGLEAMGVDPSWVGYLMYAGEVGLGNYDLKKINLQGPPLDSVRKKYRLHSTIERQLKWMGPMEELPKRFSYNHGDGSEYFG
jgi:uncharacterized protein (DUF362 family)